MNTTELFAATQAALANLAAAELSNYSSKNTAALKAAKQAYRNLVQDLNEHMLSEDMREVETAAFKASRSH